MPCNVASQQRLHNDHKFTPHYVLTANAAGVTANHSLTF